MTAMRSCRRPPDRVYGWTFGGGFQTLFKDLGEAGTPKFKRSEWTRGNAAAVEVFRFGSPQHRSSLSNPPSLCLLRTKIQEEALKHPKLIYGASSAQQRWAAVELKAQRVLDHSQLRVVDR